MEEKETTQGKESFVFFKSIFKAIEIIPSAEIKAQAYQTIALYGLCGIEPPAEADPYIHIIFAQAKIIMDNARNRYLACVENGKRGGAPKGNKNASKKQPKTTKDTTSDTTKKQANNNLNENVNVNVNIKEKEREKEKFLQSLSQKYPNLELNEAPDLEKHDLVKLEKAISESTYLQNTALSFIFQKYEKVINNFYKNFRESKISEYHAQEFEQRKYTAEEMNSLFDNIDEIDYEKL